ncbi:MAG: DOPA 4,5-dioxygenase family protein [Proteobacteria bacterium]|nr:DOPA 4,5-dioxygenase family protein [Pseudomonadota bacterium]
MIASEKDPASITGYHAHIYYDDATKPFAAALRELLTRNFDLRMGRWRDEPVGPHTKAMYQAAFAPELFSTLVPWLALNHGDLSVFIHPETGRERADHLEHALWLGEKLPLKPEALD